MCIILAHEFHTQIGHVRTAISCGKLCVISDLFQKRMVCHIEEMDRLIVFFLVKLCHLRKFQLGIGMTHMNTLPALMDTAAGNPKFHAELRTCWEREINTSMFMIILTQGFQPHIGNVSILSATRSIFIIILHDN